MLAVVYAIVPDECDVKLRELALRKYGGKKGALSKVVEEAINLLYDVEMTKQENNGGI